MPQRYAAIAPFYDLVSGEWPVYRVGRQRGIPLLRLTQGATVVDVGCGTGLNFPLLATAVGPSGHVVGVDSSAAMLRMAGRRAARMPDGQVRLVRADATRLTLGLLGRTTTDPPDGILFTYSLSLMHPWQDAWSAATELAAPGTRIVVVDMAVPNGRARVLSPLARTACLLGGADIVAHPWQRLASLCRDVVHEEARGGHVQVWAGTWPG